MMSGVRRLGVLMVCAVVAMVAAACATGTDEPSAAAASSSSAAPGLTVNVDDASGSPGDIFLTTGASAALPGATGDSSGRRSATAKTSSAVIMTKSGQVVFRHDAPKGMTLNNFREQTYRGKQVLTWWQGRRDGGHGVGTDVIADKTGKVITTLTPGGGLSADAHEFRLTPSGQALITSYRQVGVDMSSIGGPRDGQMFDCIASVVDVATGATVAQWDAMKHVPLTQTELPRTEPGATVYDPFHMNSIALAPNGDLLISMRNTSTIYDVDLHSGRIRWQLGGKASTWHLGPGVEFAFQHDAEFSDDSTVRLFNDNSSGSIDDGLSSAQWIHLDPTTDTATLQRNQTHPDHLVSIAMGNVQGLADGDVFVGWGTAPHISEFTHSGQLVYDATLPRGTYRACLDPWT